MTSNTYITNDGTQIYYKDWSDGPVVTFSRDRRGHGRSSQPSSGNDMNGYADDMAQRIEALDLKKIDVPTLHGEDGQTVPVHDSAKKAARLVRHAREIYYPGAPYGRTATMQDRINADLLAFIRATA
ncbi:alpha/beta fold hydrolase [Achromobacter sp.]|uniref:alpha/beta fold hydrolase n=1 Tax=Achromobacter sp. TaxID=134375 RepID=UPI003C7143B5